jgi:ABC-type sugar transport system substrate-binding protein
MSQGQERSSTQTMDRRQFLRYLAAMGGVAVLASCSPLGQSSSGGSAAAKKAIGFDFPYNSQAVYTNLTKFAKERAQQQNYELLLTTDEGKLDKQVANIQSWISQKIPAIVCYPIEASSMENFAEQAMNAGIVWISYTVEMEHQDGAILFPPKDSGMKLGETAADWVNKNLGGEAEVATIVYPEVEIGRQREAGYLETFTANAPNAKIVAREVAADHTNGLRVMDAILSAHPNVNVVLSIDDDAALGAYQAFLDRGHAPDDPKVWIGGQDGTQQALEKVKEGGMYRCTVAVSLRDIGYAVIDLPKRILEGGEKGNAIINPVAITHGSPELETFLSEYQ